MLCDVCKQNNASVYITKVINGEKQEINMCEVCAKDADGINIMSDLGIMTDFNFSNILGGLMDYINNTTPVRSEEISCKSCGMTLREFKQTGVLGCADCYKNLQATVSTVVNRVQGKTEHKGKIPKKLGKEIINKKYILKLKEELQKAIVEENFEKAAELRDKIRSISE